MKLTTACASSLQADSRRAVPTAQAPRKRTAAFLFCLARQPLPFALIEENEVQIGLDLARQGYVQVDRGGADLPSTLVVCSITPWGWRRIATKAGAPQ